jgi:hypothetical protein
VAVDAGVLFNLFGPGSGLCLPPVPEECLPRLQVVGRSTLSTLDAVDERKLYLFKHFARAVRDEPAVTAPEVTVSYWGHGMNSYAWTVHLVQPGLRVLGQAAYGGAFNDRAKTAAKVSELFRTVHELAATCRSTEGTNRTLLYSDFRRVGRWEAVPGSAVTKPDTLSAVRDWTSWERARQKIAFSVERDRVMPGFRTVKVGPYFYRHAETDSGLYLEVVGGSILPLEQRYTPDQEVELAEIGLTPPDDETPHWQARGLTPDDVASLVLAVAQRVWKRDPSAATY